MASALDRGELYSPIGWCFSKLTFFFSFLMLKCKFIYEKKFRKILKKIVFDTLISGFQLVELVKSLIIELEI